MGTPANRVRRRLVAVVAVVGATAVLAACGGGNGDGRLSTEEFINEGNAICADANEMIAALGELPASPEQAATYLGEFADIVSQEAESFSALTPPEDLEETVDRAITLLDEVSTAAQQASDKAAAGDVAALQELASQVNAREQELDAFAVDVGLTECD